MIKGRWNVSSHRCLYGTRDLITRPLGIRRLMAALMDLRFNELF
jgi:hypothetical protein